MKIHSRLSTPLLLATLLVAAPALAASNGYDVRASEFAPTQEESAAAVTHVLTQYCRDQGDRAGPVVITRVSYDAYSQNYFTEATITCLRG